MVGLGRTLVRRPRVYVRSNVQFSRLYGLALRMRPANPDREDGACLFRAEYARRA